MKPFIVCLCIITLLGACKKQRDAHLNLPELETGTTATRPVCGTDAVMKQLSPETKAAMRSYARTDAQAAELLLFLDFDGATVRSGIPNPSGYNSQIISGTRNCPPPSLSAASIEAIVALVKDDYAPFNIVVTTDQSVFNTYDAPNKQICIITTVPQVLGFGSGVGGVSPFAFPGFRLPFNPSFVFASMYGGDVQEVATTISHESGHSIGLGHQHLFREDCRYVTEYHPGIGTGPVSFVPIMGSGSGKRIINWYAQNCLMPVYGVTQNDFALITSQVALREDDFPGTPEGATAASDGLITGILEQAGDVDFIRVNFKSPGVVTVTSENCDLEVSVYNGGGHLQEVYNDPEDTGVTIPRLSGLRYIAVRAAGNQHVSSQFMTGQYHIRY